MEGDNLMAMDTHDTNAEIWHSESAIREWVANMDTRERKRAEERLFMAQLLPFGEQDAFTFLDLGAGNGAAARAMLSVYPRASVVLADYSPHMIEAGLQAMAPYSGRYRYVEFNMLNADWPAEMPARVDAVVTSQCVHHLPDERKRGLFQEIHDRLSPGGWYLNYDPLRASDPAVAAVWQRVGARLDPDGSRHKPPETEAQRARRENHERYLCDLESQVGYLQAAGFVAVDVYWKKLDSVIYGGQRGDD
jgi:SAM-dependent methyltransferase